MTVGLTPHFPLRLGLVSSLHPDCTFFATLTYNLFATTVQILSLTATICACMLTARHRLSLDHHISSKTPAYSRHCLPLVCVLFVCFYTATICACMLTACDEHSHTPSIQHTTRTMLPSVDMISAILSTLHDQTMSSD